MSGHADPVDHANGDSATTAHPAKSTVPAYDISLRGFSDDFPQEKLASFIRYFVDRMGEHLPLQDLDGVTIGADYSEALASVDRGIVTNYVPVPSEGVANGVAMAMAVVRNGAVKTHIVLHVGVARLSLSEEKEDQNSFCEVCLHELGHCVEHTWVEQQMPGLMLNPVRSYLPDRRDRDLYEIASASWREYVAARIGAWWSDNPLEGYDEILGGTLEPAERDILLRRALYRSDGILELFLSDASYSLEKVMTRAGYVFGHLDGREEAWTAQRSPCLFEALTGPWSTALHNLHSALQETWNSRPNWTSIEDFRRVFEAALDFMAVVGMFPYRVSNDYCFYEIP